MRVPEFHARVGCQPPARPAGFGGGRSTPRIALYSHDTQGLGHIRRNLLISRSLCKGGTSPVILLLSGVREATAWAMPDGVDCMTLPSLGKDVDGRYYPRSLGVPMEDLIQVRSRALEAALKSFDPDVLIVDKVPRGIFGELEPSLAWLRTRGRARLVLGLREILDDPESVRHEWHQEDTESAIRRYYHRLWVYGDQRVYDTAVEYRFPPDIAAMVRHTGYLNPRDAEPDKSRCGSTSADVPLVARGAAGDGPTAVCLVGGGRDGLPLAEAFLRAETRAPRSLVTGPLMPADARARLRLLTDSLPNTTMHEFVTDPCPLLESADRVIAMGGYNTICEILAYEKPALIVPRAKPRTEQLIRATRFAERGLVDVVHPDALTPAALSAWLARPSSPPRAADTIDFGGVARLPQLLEDLLVDRLEKERGHAAC